MVEVQEELGWVSRAGAYIGCTLYTTLATCLRRALQESCMCALSGHDTDCPHVKDKDKDYIG